MEFSLAAFREAVNTNFIVVLDGMEVSLQLKSIDELAIGPEIEQFSLQLTGPQAPFLPQQLYRLQHEKLGEHDLFMVPIGQDSDGFCYEIVFNLLVSR
ncbi:hypothetical protein [Paenibacillus sp. RC67]|uniref:DUF6916 family protein n=1 Tax=Paenibacillus sp. RC67 TaxID=3039392 RepID=UPI0024ADFB32|nr:hypothetical protein [Paenibacillus sp. RC67]